MNSINRLGKGKLYRSAHLSGIRTRGKHRPECTNIVEHRAGFFSCGVDAVFVLCGKINACIFFCLCDKFVDIGSVLHDYAHAVLSFKRCLDIVAYAALYCHVGYISVHILGVHAGRVSHIGVSVRIAVHTLNKEHKLISVSDCHYLSLRFLVFKCLRSLKIVTECKFRLLFECKCLGKRIAYFQRYFFKHSVVCYIHSRLIAFEL